MVKLLFIAYYFPPIGGGGVQRAQKFVQYLPTQGFLPVVVTGSGSDIDRWTPHDATLMSEIPPNVQVYRARQPFLNFNGTLLGKLERWLALPSAFLRWWVRSATAVGLRAADGARLIFATMSPFDSAEVACRLSRRLGIPWVADLRDPWALDEMRVYPTRLHRKLEMARMERALSSVALIIMNTPEATAALKEAFPQLQKKEIVTITNGFDKRDFAKDIVPRTDARFRIVHTGYLHTDLGLQVRRRALYDLLGGTVAGVDILTRSHAVLLEAVERWCEQRAEVRQDLEIMFAGRMSEEDELLARTSSVGSLIRFPGYVSHDQSLQLIRTADLLFLPMHNLQPGRRSRIVPGKTYEYMATGRPILAAVPEGDAWDFLSQCGTALLCRPDDVQGMIQILDRVYTAWKTGRTITNCNKAFVNQFERCKLTRTLAQALTGVLAREAKEVRQVRSANIRSASKNSGLLEKWAAPGIYRVDALRDQRWDEFVTRHPRGSVFHTPGWVEALRRTYGYEPLVLTTSPPGADLANGLVFCLVESWLTGRRLVSLPFSDHCEPLADRQGHQECLLAFLTEAANRENWKYVELRPLGHPRLKGLRNLWGSKTYLRHRLDLRPSLEEIFQGFHKSCIQRKIHRAKREGLTYEEGRSEALLSKLYYLLRITRRRKGLPPQPLAWFRNLIDCLGDQLSIRVASKNGTPIAGVLTLQYKKTMVYKYGGSDARDHNLGGMPFLFWRTIQEAKKKGLEELDLGRSDSENSGLVTFKDHLGADCSTLTYYRYPKRGAGLAANGWKVQTAKRVFAHLPDPVLTVAGKLLYKHIG